VTRLYSNGRKIVREKAGREETKEGKPVNPRESQRKEWKDISEVRIKNKKNLNDVWRTV